MTEGLQPTQVTEAAKVERSSRLAELKGFAVGVIENYSKTFTPEDKVGLAKLTRTKEFFAKPETLQKVLSTYDGLLSSDVQTEEVALFKGHLSFILKRGFDQHLDNPGKYVSHGFNHTLNVVGYVDSIIDTFPEVVSKVKEKYGLTESKSKFLFETLAFLHDFGYPLSESKQLGKEAHSMEGAGVINNGQTEVNGRKVAIKDVLTSIFNEEAVKDLIKSVAEHNADKVKNTYRMRIDLGNGSSFLTQGDNPEEVYQAGKDLGDTGIKRISVRFENSEEGNNFAIDFASKFMRIAFDHGKKSVDLPEIAVEEGKGYKGRGVGKNDVLGLEYSKVSFVNNPLESVIRLADNMDVTKNRFSELQEKPLFKACYYELGKSGSHFYEGNQNIERILKQVKEKGRNLDDLRKTIISHISLEEVHQIEKKLIEERMSKGEREKIIRKQWNQSYEKYMNELGNLNVNESIAYWRGFMVDQIALRPEFGEVDEVTKLEVREAALGMSSKEFRHFAGCESLKGVEVKRSGIYVTVDKNLYNELNKSVVKDEITIGDGQIFYIEVPVGQYQLRRMWDALDSVRYDSDSPRFPIYVDNEEYLAA